jgi:hypothetical protein
VSASQCRPDTMLRLRPAFMLLLQCLALHSHQRVSTAAKLRQMIACLAGESLCQVVEL